MNKKHLFLSAALFAVACNCGAQSLNKEITVERDIVPEYRDADRLRISPVVSLPQVVRQNLTYSFVDRPVGVTPSIYPLVLQNPAIERNDLFPGYAAIGYMPLFNMAASAGYRFIDNDKTRLGAWLQYNGRTYHGDVASLTAGTKEKTMLRRHTFTLGSKLRQSTGEQSWLDAQIDYTYSRYNLPAYTLTEGGALTRNQAVNNLNVAADWRHEDKSAFSYGAGAGFSRFAFVHGSDELFYNRYYDAAAARQSNITVNGDASLAFSDESTVSLGLDFSYLKGNDSFRYYIDGMPAGLLPTDLNTWLLRLTPGYHYIGANAAFDAGVRIDLTHGSGRAVHIAPDVRFSATPSPYFGFTVKAGGGEVQNSLASLFAVMPYMSQIHTYGNSHIPFTFDASVTVGPFKGAYAELFGGYARANDWLMPGYFHSGVLQTFNVRGWHGGLALGYRHGKLAQARVSAEVARSNSEDAGKGYYLWRDRAKYVIDATAKVSPIDKLNINAGYSFRGKRKAGAYSLGSVSNLCLGADYAVNARTTVFLTGENLLDRKFYFIGGVPSQGITGLAGVTYKF